MLQTHLKLSVHLYICYSFIINGDAKMRIISILIVACLAIAGCAQDNTQIANPASEHCIEQGGTLEIVDTEDGQVGMCTLPDGTVCDEWAYYNGECGEDNAENITSFEECVEAGNSVMESNPRKCEANGETFTEELSKEESCEDLHNGKWLPEFNECEGINEESCEEMGGNFDQCASACRNDPDAEECTMQCVPVCSFETPEKACESAGGEWLAEHNECEYISEENCTETGGEFDECESACRHDPDAEMCTQECVPVCKY